MNEELNDDVSVCSECDKHTNDNTETKWDKDADPYCVECFYNDGTEKKPFIWISKDGTLGLK